MVAAIALGSSTYAWFVNNTMVKTSQATLSATTAYVLLISEGATGAGSAWTTTHTMTNASNAILEPVSTTGKFIFKSKNPKFSEKHCKSKTKKHCEIADETELKKAKEVFKEYCVESRMYSVISKE